MKKFVDVFAEKRREGEIKSVTSDKENWQPERQRWYKGSGVEWAGGVSVLGRLSG